MKKQGIAIFLTFFLLIITLCGCNENTVNDREKFVGRWRYEPEGFDISGTYAFYANGTYVLLEEPESRGTWDIIDNKLVTTYLGMEDSSYYAFSDNDKTLTLTDVDDPSFSMILEKIS